MQKKLCKNCKDYRVATSGVTRLSDFFLDGENIKAFKSVLLGVCDGKARMKSSIDETLLPVGYVIHDFTDKDRKKHFLTPYGEDCFQPKD